MFQHLVFYDGECGLCDQAVQFILKKDKNKLFCFAPLKGETASKFLQDSFKGTDSVILVENFCLKPSIYIEGEAVLRICSHLPYPSKFLSFFSFVPLFITNGCYRLVARHREWLVDKSCVLPDSGENGRFLK